MQRSGGCTVCVRAGVHSGSHNQHHDWSCNLGRLAAGCPERPPGVLGQPRRPPLRAEGHRAAAPGAVPWRPASPLEQSRAEGGGALLHCGHTALGGSTTPMSFFHSELLRHAWPPGPTLPPQQEGTEQLLTAAARLLYAR
ncbi:hypothetical protein HaLaN_21007 [Haematococcus lacustris]|uniref:Uncharacterized protein n=1 Tax=Haematococcus lacustris TaxID=44745 RepID=A0A699ZQF0_HAELA|nr:hypothetical protein HaLaN_21007 [Haematococcus lacustris]